MDEMMNHTIIERVRYMLKTIKLSRCFRVKLLRLLAI